MKHAVILAHPDPGSFNAAVAHAYEQAVRGFGDEAIVRDLYLMNFDPRLRASEIPWAKGYAPGEDVVTERDLLRGAKVFVLVYPLWFNAPPAILKGYIDRVFCSGFGFQSGAGGSAPLLSGRSLLSFTSSGAPDVWIEQTGAVKALRHAFDDHVAEMCGLAVLGHKHFGGMTPGLRPDAVEEILQSVRETAESLFSPLKAHNTP